MDDISAEIEEQVERATPEIALMQYKKQSQFEKKMQEVYRITNGARDPMMSGRILGYSTNKYIHFIADTGSPVALIPRSVATRNKLEIFPTDPDEASVRCLYASASRKEQRNSEHWS